MTMFGKLGACSIAALMILSSLSGCCGGGSLCPFGKCGRLGGGGAAVATDGCSTCSTAQQSFSQPTFAQPVQQSVQSVQSAPVYSQPTYAPSTTYTQPTFAQPTQQSIQSPQVFSQGPVSSGSGTVINAPSVRSVPSGSGTVVSPPAGQSFGSGTSAPVFSGSGSR